MKRILFSLFLTAGLATLTKAQTRYEKFDSIFYEQIFTPALATMMMPKGYAEVIFYQSLSSANQVWDAQRKPLDFGDRLSYFYFIAQLNAGISSSGKLNGGVDIYYANGRLDANPGSSPFNVFNAKAPGKIRSANGITAIAPRLKFMPFRRIPLIVQTSVVFPVMKDYEDKRFFGQTDITWTNQLLYNFTRSQFFNAFVQAEVTTYFINENARNNNRYFVPLNFYGYFTVTKHVFPFISTGYAIMFQQGDSLNKDFDYVPLSAGIQFQYSLRFNLNVQYTGYLTGENYADWRSLSVGLRGVF